MKEQLFITLNEKQVREACEQWARSRTRSEGLAAKVLLAVKTVPGENPILMGAEVMFTKKRERKAKVAP